MKKKETFDAIHNAKRTRDSLLGDVAKADAAVATAQNAVEKAATDDGVTTPEKIYARSESARRELSICEITANRAKSKLDKAEEDFRIVISASILPIRELLAQKEVEILEEMKQQISPIIGERAANSDEFAEMVAITEKVSLIREHHRLIGEGLYAGERPSGPGPATIEAILNSEALL